jgi:dTDP-4-amino-4,6-dideoxygalactose transaminase
MAVARKYNLKVLEDAAQALGGEYKGKKLGTIGDVGIFSFDYGKALTTGEGGMILTNNEEIYRRAREFSDHGHEQNPNFPRGEDTRRMWGLTYRMMELQGALGLAQFKKLDFILERQKENKKRIKDGIKNIARIEFRELPDQGGDAGDTLIFFLESREKASKFAKLLAAEGLGTKNLPDAINWHFAGTWNHIFSDCSLWPKSEEILRRAIAIPIFVKMDEEKINKVINTIHNIVKQLL